MSSSMKYNMSSHTKCQEVQVACLSKCIGLGRITIKMYWKPLNSIQFRKYFDFSYPLVQFPTLDFSLGAGMKNDGDF